MPILTAVQGSMDIKIANTSTDKIKQDSNANKTAWQSFMQGINNFTEDIMPNGREAEILTAREEYLHVVF